MAYDLNANEVRQEARTRGHSVGQGLSQMTEVVGAKLVSEGWWWGMRVCLGWEAQWDKSVGSSCPWKALFALHKQRDYSEKGLSAANKQCYHTHSFKLVHTQSHPHRNHTRMHARAHTHYKHTNKDKLMQTNVHSQTQHQLNKPTHTNNKKHHNIVAPPVSSSPINELPAPGMLQRGGN